MDAVLDWLVELLIVTFQFLCGMVSFYVWIHYCAWWVRKCGIEVGKIPNIKTFYQDDNSKVVGVLYVWVLKFLVIFVIYYRIRWGDWIW
jgi:hypothetical protein